MRPLGWLDVCLRTGNVRGQGLCSLANLASLPSYRIIPDVDTSRKEAQSQYESKNDREQLGPIVVQMTRCQSHRKCAIRYGKNSADSYRDCPEPLRAGVVKVHPPFLPRNASCQSSRAPDSGVRGYP